MPTPAAATAETVARGRRLAERLADAREARAVAEESLTRLRTSERARGPYRFGAQSERAAPEPEDWDWDLHPIPFDPEEMDRAVWDRLEGERRARVAARAARLAAGWEERATELARVAAALASPAVTGASPPEASLQASPVHAALVERARAALDWLRRVVAEVADLLGTGHALAEARRAAWWEALGRAPDACEAVAAADDQAAARCAREAEHAAATEKARAVLEMPGPAPRPRPRGPSP